MSGHHHHSHNSLGRSLYIALFLTLAFALVEVIGGIFANSLALLGDAGHMFTDGLSLALAAFASWLATRPASSKHSFGLGRAEILVAFFNAVFMIAIVIYLSVEAISRLITPIEVQGETVTLIAMIGLGINLLVAYLLSREHQNINVRGALLHVMGDLLGSVAAIIAGIAVQVTGWSPIDPILTLVIVILILISAFRLLKESLHLLLDGVPPGIDLNQVRNRLSEIDGIIGVKDLHVWKISGEKTALTAEVSVNNLSDWDEVLVNARDLLHHELHIDHVTLEPSTAV